VRTRTPRVLSERHPCWGSGIGAGVVGRGPVNQKHTSNGFTLRFIYSQAEDGVRTKQWYTQLQYHAQGMGAWRKRRNALANIMINGMLARS